MIPGLFDIDVPKNYRELKGLTTDGQVIVRVAYHEMKKPP